MYGLALISDIYSVSYLADLARAVSTCLMPFLHNVVLLVRQQHDLLIAYMKHCVYGVWLLQG